MSIGRLAIILTILFALTGCYFPITGRVIDAETQQPIEGAVVLVEWTKKHGFGDHWTESYKVVEVLSGKDGKVKIEGCYSPFVEPPDVTVYKKGYVAWSNRWIFPNWEKRSDFSWGSGYMYKLEKFTKIYSYIDHDGFVSRAINDTIGWENKQLFIKTYQDAEESSIIRERSEREKKRSGGIKQK